jgi:hypothetical protein
MLVFQRRGGGKDLRRWTDIGRRAAEKQEKGNGALSAINMAPRWGLEFDIFEHPVCFGYKPGKCENAESMLGRRLLIGDVSQGKGAVPPKWTRGNRQ